MAKAQRTRRTRPGAVPPFGKLDLRVEVSQEEILADLRSPAPPKRMRRS